MQTDLSQAKMMSFGEKLLGELAELAIMFFANMAYIGEKLGLSNRWHNPALSPLKS